MPLCVTKCKKVVEQILYFFVLFPILFYLSFTSDSKNDFRCRYLRTAGGHWAQGKQLKTSYFAPAT